MKKKSQELMQSSTLIAKSTNCRTTSLRTV
nr:MAG TPA: hypothetical protein [Caudoviricetes sp.]